MTKILDLLKLTPIEKVGGVWLSGIPYDGEFKEWYSNKVVHTHSCWKNSLLHGSYRQWYDNGMLYRNELWRDGKLIKDYMND